MIKETSFPAFSFHPQCSRLNPVCFFFLNNADYPLIFGWPKCERLIKKKDNQLNIPPFSMAEGFFVLFFCYRISHRAALWIQHSCRNRGSNFPPLTFRGHTLKNNDRLQSQDVASEYILKEIYFTPQNKTKKNKKKEDRD